MRIRNLLPSMVSISNNSRLTTDVYQKIMLKFSVSEVEDFQKWLQLVEQNQNATSNRKSY